jgi:hypothetical protein
MCHSERNAAMPDIPIHNETEYSLTATMREQITRDALEHFGESIRSIRVQYGIDRHAFNARTGEIRYAFSPGDFGLVDMKAPAPDLYQSPRDIPRVDDEEEEEVEEVVFAEVDLEDEEEEEEESSPTFRSLEEEFEEVDEEEDETEFAGLEDEFEEVEDEDRDFLFNDEEYN